MNINESAVKKQQQQQCFFDYLMNKPNVFFPSLIKLKLLCF